jgi:hypothetical protein
MVTDHSPKGQENLGNIFRCAKVEGAIFVAASFLIFGLLRIRSCIIYLIDVYKIHEMA